jgi:hypothetical protein
MFIRKYWLPLSVFIVAICAVGLYYLQTQPPKAPIKIYKPVEPLEKPTAEVPEGETSQGGHVHADGTWHAKPQAPITRKSGNIDSVRTVDNEDSVSGREVSAEELAFWKKHGVAPPPQGYTYVQPTDGTRHLQKKNVMIASVNRGTTPEFNLGWLPDDAYYYYDALIGLSSGENLIGVGRLTPAETARAREMLDAFENAWAVATNISFNASGAYEADHAHRADADADQAIAEKERELKAELGISENRQRDFDVDVMREILTQIQKELSQ